MIPSGSVLVFGASCQVGHCLLPRLRARAWPVLAVSRQPHSDGDGVRWVQAQLPQPQPPVLPPGEALQAIVSFGPLDGLAGWLEQCDEAPAPRLVATGSMSVSSKRDAADAGERELARRLAEGEARLAGQCRRLGIDWLVLRPTLIHGVGLDRNLTPIVRLAARWRVFPIPLARGLRQPVHADDVARAVVAALSQPVLGGRTLEIGGGERLEYRAMFRRVHASLPFVALPLPLPLTVLRALSLLWPAMRGPVSRLGSDLLADNRELEAWLGVHPRGFAPSAGDWGLDRGR